MDQKACAQQAKSTAHVGRTNHGTVGTATCGALVEGGEWRHGKRRDAMCCRKMSHTPEPKSSPSLAAAATPTAQTRRGYRGLGLVGVRVGVARRQAAPPPSPPHRCTRPPPLLCCRPRFRRVRRQCSRRDGEEKGRGRRERPQQGRGREGTEADSDPIWLNSILHFTDFRNFSSFRV